MEWQATWWQWAQEQEFYQLKFLTCFILILNKKYFMEMCKT